MKKKILIISTMCLLLSSGIRSQVTIGSGEAPNKGALLDLKTKTDGSSDKGLGMPRVELSNLRPTNNADLAKSIGNTTGSYDMAEHVGLIVYNVKAATYDHATCRAEGVGPAGLYVWDGSQWQGLGVKGASAIGAADPLESETATTLTDRDGNTYHISSFGTAGIWMTENLRTKTAPGLVAINENIVASSTEMYYVYPNGGNPYTGQPGTWTAQQGLLYNWAATMNKVMCTINQGYGEANEQTEVIQGICPFGWHVPSDREWNELEAVYAPTSSNFTLNLTQNFTWEASDNTATTWRPNASNVFGQGKSMKSTTALNGIVTHGDSKSAAAGGFNILLAGYAANGSASSYGDFSYLWTSSSSSATDAWYRLAGSDYAGMYRHTYDRNYLSAIRCKKN